MQQITTSDFYLSNESQALFWSSQVSLACLISHRFLSSYKCLYVEDRKTGVGLFSHLYSQDESAYVQRSTACSNAMREVLAHSTSVWFKKKGKVTAFEHIKDAFIAAAL